MPNKPNAKKALRQDIGRNARNTQRKEAFRTAIKAVRKADSKEAALKLISQAQKALDKAAKTGVIKKNTASRKLARLVKTANKVK